MEKFSKKKSHPENLDLATRIKKIPSSELDRLVHGIASAETAKIDCTTCGKCCNKLQPPFHQQDIERIAKKTGITAKTIKDEILVFDAKHQIHYLKQSPCYFLCDKKCTIYGLRPQSCADFPYLKQAHFKYRIKQVLDYYEICPIVYNTIERLKLSLGLC